MWKCLLVKYPLLSVFNETWIVLTDFQKKLIYQVLSKSVQWELNTPKSNSNSNNNNNNNNRKRNVSSREIGIWVLPLTANYFLFNECDALQIAEKCGNGHTSHQDMRLMREENELLTNQLQQIQVTYDERGGFLCLLCCVKNTGCLLDCTCL